MQAAAIRKHCVDKGAREVDTVDLPYVIRRPRPVSSAPSGASAPTQLEVDTVSTTFPPQQPGRHVWAELLRLTTAVRRLAFDTSLPPAEAMGRIRDAFQDYDQQGGM
jgi:hypothetical protein